MIINDSVKINEVRATFMDKLKSSKVGDSFNIFSGSRNFVVTQVANDRFKVVPGKGYDKGMTAYINKCYLNPKEDQIVTRNALQNFIRTINSNNGWREEVDTNPENELNESDTKSDLIKNLEKEGKLYLVETKPGSKCYRESSGKSYRSIELIINKFNKKYGTSIICYNDGFKDATYIEV